MRPKRCAPPTWRSWRRRRRWTGVDRESLDYIIVAHNFGDVMPDNVRSRLRSPRWPRASSTSWASSIPRRSPTTSPSAARAGCRGSSRPIISSSPATARRVMVIGAETLSRIGRPARPRQHDLCRRRRGDDPRGDAATAGGHPVPRRAQRHPRARLHAVDGQILRSPPPGRRTVPQDGRPQALRVCPEDRAAGGQGEPGEGRPGPRRHQEAS